MPTRKLSTEELVKFRNLFQTTQQSLRELAGSDPALLFAYRRKLFKEFQYEERSKPSQRRKLKRLRFKEQDGRCKLCLTALEPLGRNAVLDRLDGMGGYTQPNTRLLCAVCDRKVQEERGFRG